MKKHKEFGEKTREVWTVVVTIQEVDSSFINNGFQVFEHLRCTRHHAEHFVRAARIVDGGTLLLQVGQVRPGKVK